MTGESANSQKMLLAAAIADGTAIAKWASSNEVPERTAYRWAAEPEVRSEIESIRRRALDEAIGRMARRATWAVDGIVELGESTASESVRLSALRAVMSDLIAVSNFAGLECAWPSLRSNSMPALATRVKCLRANAGTHQAEATDRSAWDWYAGSCSCGLPPGECSAHPRARSTQRPPEGNWRVWAYVAGRGAGKTRAGASWIHVQVPGSKIPRLEATTSSK